MVISKLDEAKRLKFQIKLLDEKINELKNSLDIQGMRYADLPKIEGFKNNLIELQVERLVELETKKYHLQMRIDEVLDELSKLPELSYKVVYYRDFVGLRWVDISRKIGHSVSQCLDFMMLPKTLICSIILLKD